MPTDRRGLGLGAQELIRGKIRTDYEGSPQKGRYYDGLIRKPDGTYIGVEVKSGGANLKYDQPGNTQRQFDARVSVENPAIGMLNGEEIKVTEVMVVHIP